MFLDAMGETVVLRLYPSTSLLLARACRMYAGNGDGDGENTALETMAIAFAALGALGRMNGMGDFTAKQRAELERICATLEVA